jgi:DNA-directed RNA polymerase subunit H (RpoH/RPB5)
MENNYPDFNRYVNINICFTEYRKYKRVSEYHNKEKFRSIMQAESYVISEFTDKEKNKNYLVYLFNMNSKYTISSGTADMKKLLKGIQSNYMIIFLTYDHPMTYIKKAIMRETRLNIRTFLYSIVDCILPRSTLAASHRILSNDEVNDICNNQLHCTVNDLEKISDNDPQCFWIGASVGHVLEIKMYSVINLYYISYRFVIPGNVKVINLDKDIDSDGSVVDNTEEVDNVEEIDLEATAKSNTEVIVKNKKIVEDVNKEDLEILDDVDANAESSVEDSSSESELDV